MVWRTLNIRPQWYDGHSISDHRGMTDIQWTITRKNGWWLANSKIFIKMLRFNPRTPRGVSPPLAFFPCNFFDDSNGENRLIVSDTRDGRHILAYVTSSWRCHVTYVMTSYVHDGGQNTLFLLLFVNRDNFWCRCDKVMKSVSFLTKLRS